jgi:hypothetical protein
MDKVKKIICAITLIIFLASCSWQEYFVISNTSQSELIFNYTVKEVKNGFPVFTNQPLLYKLNNSKEIDWNSNQIPQDLDTSLTGFKLKIPANCAVVFGELSNDHYKAYNQTFINGRVFNLKELEILHSNDTIIIVPANFDTYFKKTNGTHILEIK